MLSGLLTETGECREKGPLPPSFVSSLADPHITSFMN